YAFPTSAATMNVAMGRWPTGVLPRPSLPMPVAPDLWSEWRRHSRQGYKGLIDAWQRLFSVGTGGGNYDPDGDKEREEARELCKEELLKPNPSRGITGGYRDVENCARGHVSERCGGNKVDYGTRRR